MTRHLAAISLLVRDYDEAIEFYVDKAGFELLEDTPMTAEKRWVRIAPAGSTGSSALLLARAANEAQRAQIGNQCGGRVWLFLHTEDFWRDYHAMRAQGVHFCEAPREEAYATVVVWEDLYGNRWDLLQPKV